MERPKKHILSRLSMFLDDRRIGRGRHGVVLGLTLERCKWRRDRPFSYDR